MYDKSPFDQTVTIDGFIELLEDEELPPESLAVILAVLSEIKPHAEDFQANTPELVMLANWHSPTFQTLPPERQRFFAGVMSMPIFFMTLPLSEKEADAFMREGN